VTRGESLIEGAKHRKLTCINNNRNAHRSQISDPKVSL
jgi:hypothetical protein